MNNLITTLQEEFSIRLAALADSVPRQFEFPDAVDKIKVAIGMRRTGKTFCIYQKILNLLKQGVQLSRILYINFEDDRLLPLNQQQFAALLEGFYSLHPENHDELCYFFLDEIQNVDEWSLVIRRFFDTKQIEFYLTGSSAKLLSKEISTSLRGRSLAKEVWPYSFDEYIQAKNISIDRKKLGKITLDHLKKLMLTYLKEGGFPEVTDYIPAIRQQTLQEYVQIVILRDIVERYQLKSNFIIKYLIKQLLQGVSSNFSINKIYNDLKSQGYAVGKETLYTYLNYIEDAYLAFSVPLYSESIRKSQVNLRKIYVIDGGLAQAFSFSKNENLGRLFENLIYLDLRRMGCQIYYYLTKKRYEVDFFAVHPLGQSQLIQVVWDMEDQETYQREHRALEEAKTELNIPGKIVTLESYLKEGVSWEQ